MKEIGPREGTPSTPIESAKARGKKTLIAAFVFSSFRYTKDNLLLY